MTRIPPVFFCPYCEYNVKVQGLKAGNRAQYINKICSECATAEASVKTGADRGAK